MHRIILLATGHVVKRLAVRREYGGVLAPVLRGEQRVLDDLMGGGIVDEHIAREVEDFDALIGHDVESLARLIRREGAILAAGMPIGINHRASELFVAGLQPLSLPIDLEHRGPMIATHMEYEARGIGLMG